MIPFFSKSIFAVLSLLAFVSFAHADTGPDLPTITKNVKFCYLAASLNCSPANYSPYYGEIPFDSASGSFHSMVYGMSFNIDTVKGVTQITDAMTGELKSDVQVFETAHSLGLITNVTGNDAKADIYCYYMK